VRGIILCAVLAPSATAGVDVVNFAMGLLLFDDAAAANRFVVLLVLL
jgi:hypothetical protein